MNKTDASNPFAEAAYTIRATPKVASQQEVQPSETEAKPDYSGSDADYQEFISQPVKSDDEVRQEYLLTDLRREIESANVPPVAYDELRSRFGLTEKPDTPLAAWQLNKVAEAEKLIRKRLGKTYPELAATPQKEKKEVKPQLKPQKPTAYQLRLYELSEKLADLTDIILYGIASSSYTFSWKDKKGTKGLAKELGLSQSMSEMRSRIGILSNKGYTVEQLAHHIWEETEHLYDTEEIRNELISILYHVTSRVKALNMLEERIAERNGAGDFYEYGIDEEALKQLEHQQQQELEVEILAQEAAQELENLITIAVEYGALPEDLENLHTATDIVEHLKLLEDEQLWEQEQTSDKGGSESSVYLHTEEGAASEEEVRLAERGNRPAEEGAAVDGDSGAGANADTHRVEEPTPQHTEAQRKLADQSIREYDQSIEQAEKELLSAQSERSQKLKAFGRRQANESQGSLFGDTTPKEELFDELSSDYSQQNMERIFKPIEDRATKAKNNLESLKEGREAFVRNAERNAASQGDITHAETQPRSAEKEDHSVRAAEANLTLNANVYSTDGIVHESPHIEVANRIKQDALRFAKVLAKLASLEHDTDRNGRRQICDVNIAPVGGEVNIILWSKTNPEHGVYISIPYESHYTDSYDDYYLGREILWRTTERSNKNTGNNNQYVQSGITAKDFAELIVEALNEKAKKVEKASRNTNNSTNFEEPITTSLETAVDGGLNESQNTSENGRNDNRSLSDAIRQDTAKLDGGQPTSATQGNDAVGFPEGVSDIDSQQSIRPRTPTNDSGIESDRSGGNRNESDSDTDRHVRGGLRTRRTGRADERRVRGAREPSSSGDILNRRNHVIEDANNIVPKGEIAKLKANIKAIRLLKKLEQEVRDATPEEMKVLSQYSGWGGLSEVLSKSRKWDTNWVAKYKAYHDQLVELLTPEELDAAVSSTINAHYTSGAVVTEMWRIAQRLGFNGGTVLEPASGIGNFFGLMPKHLAEKSALKAYELDIITGRIMAKLYPDAHVKVAGYESSTDTGIDLVITNVPFGQIAPYDKHHKDLSRFSLHNYFIAKSIRQLAPNGLAITISSSSTMDSGASAKFRQWVTNEGNADFIGAIRLPNNAFADNAGTTVTTDILIFRKRDSGKASPFAQQLRYALPFKDTVDDKGNDFTIDINEYYVNSPSMMLGEMMLAHEAKAGGLYSANDATLVPHKGQSLQEALSKAVAQLPENISDISSVPQQQAVPADEKEGTLVEKDGKIYEVENGALTTPEWAGKTLNTLKKKKVSYEQVAKEYLKIKNCANNLLDAERENSENIEELRTALNKAYDAFVKEYGRLNNNIKFRFLLDSDIDYNTVFALENVTKHTTVDGKGNPKHTFTIEKADIFSKRVVFPVQEPATAESLTDAIEISIAYRGSLDVDYIAELINTTTEAVEAEMLATGLGFINPETGLLEDKDSYLSGFVRTKYRQAIAAAEGNPYFAPNVRALKEVLPADIPATQIKFKLGSTFIDSRYVKAFVRDKLRVEARIQYNKTLNLWIVDVKGGSYSAENTTTYGTKRMTAITLLEKGLNQRQPEIYDTVYEGSKKTRVKNADDTVEAQNALMTIASEFESYIAENEQAMAQIETTYNEQYNDYVEKKFSEPSIKHYPNASKSITLRVHQKVAVSKRYKGFAAAGASGWYR